MFSTRTPPTVASTSFTLAPPSAKKKLSAAPEANSSAPRITFGTSTGRTSRSVRLPPASMASTVVLMVPMAEKPRGTRLPLRSPTDLILLSLRTKNGVRSGCSAPIMRSLSCLPARATPVGLHRFGDVGDAEVDLAAVHERQQHRLAGGRLHQHIHAALFLEHAGDGRARGVVERARLQ